MLSQVQEGFPSLTLHAHGAHVTKMYTVMVTSLLFSTSHHSQQTK